MKKNRFLTTLPPFLLGLFLVGCIGLPSKAVKLSVPYVPQNPDACGAASLSMLLQYYGHSVPLEEVEGYLFVPVLKGTTPELIVDCASQKGLPLLKSHENYGFLLKNLERGLPSIVFFGAQKEDKSGHFAVVTGVNKNHDRIRLHNGEWENRWMLKESFLEQWERGRYTVLWSESPQDVGVGLE